MWLLQLTEGSGELLRGISFQDGLGEIIVKTEACQILLQAKELEENLANRGR